MSGWIYSRVARPHTVTITVNDSKVKLNILTSDKATHEEYYLQWQPSEVEYTHDWQGHIRGCLHSMTVKSSWIYSPVARPHARTIRANDSQVRLNILTSGNATYQDDYSKWQPGQVEYTHQWQCHIPGRLQSVAAKSSWIYSPVTRPNTRTITANGSQVRLNILTSGNATYQDDYNQW